MSVVRSLKPCPGYSGSECREKTKEQGNKAIGVFETGFTGSTGCVLSFNPVMWSRMEKPQIHAPLAELSACYAQGRAGNIKEPQINADERRYEFNNSINIFQQARTTRIHRTHFPEVPT